MPHFGDVPMKIFFASACSSKTHNECWAETGVRRLLFSYANDKAGWRANRHLYMEPQNTIMVDSGAFTAWTKGNKIDVRQYIDFCQELRDTAKCRLVFVNLDVIPGRFRVKPTRQERLHSAREGWRNFGMMAASRLPVLHVFHQHEEMAWLKDIAAASDYVGVSPANDVSVPERLRWLDKVFSTVGTSVRAHGFGVTTTRLLERFPFYSVDSSSWLAPSLYGGVLVFTGRALAYVSKAQYRNMRGLVAPHFVPCAEGYKYVTVLSLRSYLALEKYITEVWEARGLQWEESWQVRTNLEYLIYSKSQRSTPSS